MTVDPEALAWLAGQLGADRAATRRELEKLGALCRAGSAGSTWRRRWTCVGDMAGLSLDDALFAATAGDVATADRALELAMAEGASRSACCARR